MSIKAALSLSRVQVSGKEGSRGRADKSGERWEKSRGLANAMKIAAAREKEKRRLEALRAAKRRNHALQRAE